MYLLQFFEYKHLSESLQKIAKPFYDLAEKMINNLPSKPEATTTIRKLLNAKDCAMRADQFK